MKTRTLIPANINPFTVLFLAGKSYTNLNDAFLFCLIAWSLISSDVSMLCYCARDPRIEQRENHFTFYCGSDPEWVRSTCRFLWVFFKKNTDWYCFPGKDTIYI